VILIGGGVLLATPVAALGALSLAGFSATGPVAGQKISSFGSLVKMSVDAHYLLV
jgi:hypothetical protein